MDIFTSARLEKRVELRGNGWEVLNRQNGVFWDCFSSIFFFTQPWDHTPVKILKKLNFATAAMVKERFFSTNRYRVVFLDNGANVGAPCHPCLAIGSMVQDQQ